MGLLEMLRGEEPGPIKKLLNYQNKGQFGEYLLEYAVSSRSISGNCFVFRNLYIPHGTENRYSEIDLLLVHERGIFVFESKNYSGWIFGGETDLYWTQRFASGETHRFYNPIRQNYNHIKSLSTFLHLPLEHFYSCIIFSDHCSLRSIPPYSSQYTILYQHEVVRWLQSCLQQQPLLYSDEQLAALINTLQDAQNFAPYIQDEHRYQVWEQTHGTTCPFCGSPLVLRNGKYGRFWGCSSYPKCKFTKKEY